MYSDRAAKFFLGFVLLLPMAGCPGTLDDKERFLGGDMAQTSACGDVPSRIFAPSCGGAGCHGPNNPQQGLDLESPGVIARVLNVHAKTCSGILADPNNPAGSLIYSKLLEGPSCGSRMPLARSPLSLADTECIKEWILSLAPAADGGTTGDGGK